MAMKILDWMHRKLHPATNYSRVSSRKAAAFEQDAADSTLSARRHLSATHTELDTEIPLLHVNIAEILSIGTLGHPHPLHYPHWDYPHLPEVPKLDSPEKELPVVSKPLAQITLLQPAVELLAIKTEQPIVEVDVNEEKMMAEPLLMEDRERRERTTLADLFAADGEQPPSIVGVTKSTPGSDLKFRNCKDEKKIKKLKKKEDDLESTRSAAAAKTIHRMITRIVKKKVHPEAVTTGRKGGGAATAGDDMLLLGGGGGKGIGNINGDAP